MIQSLYIWKINERAEDEEWKMKPESLGCHKSKNLDYVLAMVEVIGNWHVLGGQDKSLNDRICEECGEGLCGLL